MPVSSEVSVAGPYTPNGVTTAFSFAFKAASAAEVVAVDPDGVTISTALYSVTLDDDEGGTLTFGTAPELADYSAIYILSNPELTQPSDFDNAGPSFNPSALTRAIDRAAIRDLRLKRDLDRSIKFGFGESPQSIPSAANRAGRFLAFDAGGDVIAASGSGADSALRTDLADPDFGPSLLAFKQSGTGAASRTLEAKLFDAPAAPEDFTGNPSEALLAAATAHTEIRLARGETYTLPTLVNLSALQKRRIYLNGATIEADAAFTGTHLISMSGDSEIIGPGTIDGTNVDAPLSAYASGVYAGVGIYITGTGDNGVIDGVDFVEFQSGPILHDSATTRNGFKVRNCTFTDNQKYVTDATNAIVAMHGVSNSLMEDCRAVTYNWKAFYFANGAFNQIVRCHTNGGVIGHASHFLAGGSDNSIIDCTHTGIGFGVKVDDELRPTISNFKLNGGRCAIYVQSCVDFAIIGGQAFDPAAQAIVIDSANGDVSGSVIGFRGVRTTPGSSSNHVGIRIESFAAGVASGIVVSNCYFRNFLYGIHAPNSGFAQTDINITGNEFRNTGQYGILAYLGSGVISGNLIEMDGAAVEAAIHVERDSVTTTGNIEISNNVMRGCTADNIELLTRLHHKSIRVINNRSDGGTVFLNYNGNGNAADTVSVLEVVGNQGVGLTTGISAAFNTTTSTRAKIEGNNFVNGSFVPVANSLSNLTNVTNLATTQRGTATLAAGTVAVSLPIAEPNTSYRVTLSCGAAETLSWASKATGGFTINSSNAGSTAAVDWTISR